METKNISLIAGSKCHLSLVSYALCLFFTFHFSLFTFNSFSQGAAINSTGAAADNSAMLDISATNQGIRIPRVKLLSTTDVTTIQNPVNSLLVYDSLPAGDITTTGYYYWDTTATPDQWVKLATGSNWQLTGNSGTNSGTNFLGTTDNVSVRFKTNNTERMIIDSIGKVGIGTNTPIIKLHIVDDNPQMRLQNKKTGINANNGIWQIASEWDGNGSTGFTIKPRNDDGSYINSPFQINRNADVIFWDGRVGIGTENPSYKLDVNGTIASGSTGIEGKSYFRRSSDGSVASAVYQYGDDFHIGSWTSSGSLIFETGTGPTTRMSILSNGNVGIGTTSPAGKLHIISDEGVTSGLHYLSFIQRAANDAGSLMFGYTSDGVNTTGAIIRQGGTTGKLFLGTYGTNQALTIDNGSVGIGTTVPAYLLHVKHPTGNLVTRFEGLTNSYSSKLYISSSSSGDGGMFYEGTNLMNIFSYGDLRFNVGTGNISGTIANERMVIKQNGYIGIGITSPVTKLDVAGSARFVGATVNVAGELFYDTPSKTYQYYDGTSWKVLGTGTITNTSTQWTTNGSNIYNSNAGNVGIGITVPTQKLDVSGNIKSTGYGIFPTGIVPAATGAPDGKIFSPSGDYLGQTTWGINYNEGTPDYIEFNNSSTVTSRIALDDGSAHFALSTGKVGIGTTEPGSYKLNVVGTARLNSLTLGNSEGSDAADDRFYLNWSSGSEAFLRAAQNVPLRLQTNNGASELTLLADGNVGIGTTNPRSKLDVNGSIIIGSGSDAFGGAIVYDASLSPDGLKYYDAETSQWRILNSGGVTYSGTLWGQSGSDIYYNSGSVGIGTTAISAGCRLTLDRSGTNGIALKENGTVRGYFGIDAGNTLLSGAVDNDMVIRSEDDLFIGTGGNNINMVVDASGRITKPNQPSFYAYATADQADVSTSEAAQKILLAGTKFNVGNYYSTADSRFVAPVAGIYFFHGVARIHDFSGGYIWAHIYLNGSRYASESLNESASIDYRQISITSIINMAAGDYVELWESTFNDAACTVKGDETSTYFMGYLIQ